MAKTPHFWTFRDRTELIWHSGAVVESNQNELFLFNFRKIKPRREKRNAAVSRQGFPSAQSPPRTLRATKRVNGWNLALFASRRARCWVLARCEQCKFASRKERVLDDNLMAPQPREREKKEKDRERERERDVHTHLYIYIYICIYIYIYIYI